MRIVVLAGGIGGARFLRGLLARRRRPDRTPRSPSIGNTADDITLFGLRVCPDLDTVMYTLGGGIHEEQGWGRADETFTVKEELAAYGVGAALVRARRPRLRHPHRPHPDARRRLPAVAGHRGAVRALAAAACGCCR